MTLDARNMVALEHTLLVPPRMHVEAEPFFAPRPRDLRESHLSRALGNGLANHSVTCHRVDPDDRSREQRRSPHRVGVESL